MSGETDKDERRGLRGANSRRDRLKAKLRENLKRRKSQARERGKTTGAPSNDHEKHLTEEAGKRGE